MQIIQGKEINQILTSEGQMNTVEKVTYANFRLATKEESEQAHGGYSYQLLTLPWKIACKFFGTLEMYRKGPDLLSWETSYLQQLSDRVSLWSGYKDVEFLNTQMSFISDRYLFTHEDKILKAFFSHHRNDKIFENSISMKKIYEILMETFPDETFDMNDLILTCEKSYTKTYRALLHQSLKGDQIRKFQNTIKENAKATLENWSKRVIEGEKEIDITHETRCYAAKNFSELLFGEDKASIELAKSIEFINEYTFSTIMKKPTPEKKQEYERVLWQLGNTINAILKLEDTPLFNQKDFTSAQKKAMIFTLLFAGQETTASLLTYLLWKLASNPELQKMLQKEIDQGDQIVSDGNLNKQIQSIQNLFNQCIREFTPAYGVGRLVKEDTCLEYKLEGEEKVRKRIFFKGEIVGAYINEYAKNFSGSPEPTYSSWLPFGYGTHSCPGEKLAVAEIIEFALSVIKNYTIKTEQKQLKIVGQITSTFDEPVYITLEKRVS